MAIKRTPWFNIPFQHWLELLCIEIMLVSTIGFSVIGFPCILYMLYVGNLLTKALCLLYLTFVYYDRHSGDNGGRGAGVAWVRNLKIWKYCVNYFPLDLVKTADLSPDKNYLMCVFPHGILSFGVAVTFMTNHSKWSELFPRIRSKCSTLNFNLIAPVSRELSLSLGFCTASANSLTTLVQQSNDPNDPSNRDGYTSNAVALVVGGAQESFYAVPNTYKFVLKNRKGFVRIAIRTGTSLVPVISFGENHLFKVIHYKPGSWGRWIQDNFKKFTRIAPVLFCGRGYLTENFGYIPRRHPITLVIGAPIHLEKNPNPTADDIDRVHQLFCAKLVELFETHKSKYVDNSEKVQLEII